MMKLPILPCAEKLELVLSTAPDQLEISNAVATCEIQLFQSISAFVDVRLK